MTDYSAPLADMRFVLENIVDLPALASLPGFEHAEPEVVDGVLEESGDPIAYEGERGVRRVLEELAASHGWTPPRPEREGGPLIALTRAGSGVSISGSCRTFPVK